MGRSEGVALTVDGLSQSFHATGVSELCEENKSRKKCDFLQRGLRNPFGKGKRSCLKTNKLQMKTAPKNKPSSYSLMAVGLLLLCGITTSSGKDKPVPASAVVYPTGVWPVDVLNVRAAVTGGGTVLLKATNNVGQPTAFNFGTPENLPTRAFAMTTDVNIVGETVGSSMTTIQGGNIPARGDVPVNSRIQGIYFNGPRGQAILIHASTGCEIIGNRISDVVPVHGHNPFFGDFTTADGIDLFGTSDPLHAITGKVRVADNVIQNLAGDAVNAIQFDSVAADSEITGNTINLGPGDHSIQGIGINAFRSHSSVLIDQNILGPDMATNGIAVAGEHEAFYHVSRNTVICQNPIAEGILVDGGEEASGSEGTVGAVVEKNSVTMHNSQVFAVGLNGLVTNAVVGENKIDGDGGAALFVDGFDQDMASLNRFQGNDITHFTSSVADVYFGPGSHDNVLVGHCGSIIDLGVNNSATCATQH
jgi:hypothetical protein